jgi:2-haloacid dehalogenase/putative hydrolase of the HAD superfamily
MKVVFDFGGVVFNWKPVLLLQQVLPQRAQDEAGGQLWAKAIFQGFHPGSDWALFDQGSIEPAALAQRIALRTGLHADEVSSVIAAIPPHLVPDAGTVALMDDLRQQGHQLYYLSNMPASYADELERSHTFFDWFEDGIFSARVGQIKPNADIFQTAVQRFATQGEATVFIDDVQHNIDAAHAHTQGWQGIRFESAQQVRAALPSSLLG